MTDKNIRLRDVFFDTTVDASFDFTDRVEQSKATDRVREYIPSKVPGLDWVATWNSTSELLAEILDLPLSMLLLTALNRYRKLQEYADPEKYPPDQELRLAMDCRSISTTHRPTLIFTWNGQEIEELVFTVKLTIELQVLQLIVQAGRIKRIELGRCEGSGAIFLEDEPIVRRKLGELNLPGVIDLGEGWVIPRDSASVKKEKAVKKEARVTREKKSKTDIKAAHKPRHFWRRFFLFLFLLLLVAGAFVILQGGVNLGHLAQQVERLFSQSNHVRYQPPPPSQNLRLNYIPNQPPAPIQHTRPTYTPHKPQVHPEDSRPAVTAKPSRSPTAQHRYALVIKTTPSKATIRIEGANYNGPYKPGLRLPRGKYSIRTSTAGGSVRYDTVTIRNRDVHKHIAVGGFH